MVQKNIKIGRDLLASLSFEDTDYDFIIDVGKTIKAVVYIYKVVNPIGAQPIHIQELHIPISHFDVRVKEGYEKDESEEGSTDIFEAKIKESIVGYLIYLNFNNPAISTVEEYKNYVLNYIKDCKECVEEFERTKIDFTGSNEVIWKRMLGIFRLFYLYSE